MEELLARVWENLTDRVTGPMWLRLVLQPTVAAIFAARDGWRDAHDGRPPYFWNVLTFKEQRRELIRDGWGSIGKVFIMALVIDTIYQIVVQRWVYPFETLLVAFLLAVVPYILIRGPLNRVISRLTREKTTKL
ncbi:MAG TPA: hypothetical protein VL501_03630 [Pyrinomonadaceae bacterium]|nr:hypothetical protein [Pyrinomonadaceae bacterium]